MGSISQNLLYCLQKCSREIQQELFCITIPLYGNMHIFLGLLKGTIGAGERVFKCHVWLTAARALIRFQIVCLPVVSNGQPSVHHFARFQLPTIDVVEVWISGSHMCPALEVVPVSLVLDTTVPSNTTDLNCSSVSGFEHLLLLYFVPSHFLRVLLLLLCGFLHHSAPFLSVWSDRRLKCTVYFGCCTALVLDSRLCQHRCKLLECVSGASTWLVSGAK